MIRHIGKEQISQFKTVNDCLDWLGKIETIASSPDIMRLHRLARSNDKTCSTSIRLAESLIKRICH